jgi:hypothetical protein
MRVPRSASFLLLILLIPPPASGGVSLDLKVSPPVSVEPAHVVVRVRVAADSANRFLEVVADGPQFRRSSQIPLDGERAPRLNTFEFPGLPTGTYEVTGTLVGANGLRARVSRTLIVAPGLGDGRITR